MMMNYTTLPIMEDKYDDARIAYLTIILDMSGSMTGKEKVVYSAVQKTLKTLAEKENEDIEYRVRIVTFNNSVKVFNETYLPPDQLSELFTPGSYRCTGGTNLGAIVGHIDKTFTRSSELMKNTHKGDPKATTVIITDFVGTDSKESRNQAMNTISSNRLFQKANTCLCVFCGPESSKADAIALCGCEDNLMALQDSDFAAMLAPVLIGSTLNMTDGTHVGGSTTNQTPSEQAQEQKKRNEAGEKGAESLSDAELAAEMARMFGNQTGN